MVVMMVSMTVEMMDEMLVVVKVCESVLAMA